VIYSSLINQPNVQCHIHIIVQILLRHVSAKMYRLRGVHVSSLKLVTVDERVFIIFITFSILQLILVVFFKVN
jgi:hypothetical protein